MPYFSIIVPVYNRPGEIAELLESLDKQTFSDFELIIVEDGSSSKSDAVIEGFREKINIKYLDRENQGPSLARNTGMEAASGDYFLFVDSDCILPPEWMERIHARLKENPVDCFGGPDKAAGSFNDVQKAISFSMTSFITTGGIRGGKHHMDKFYPRSYNLGISKKLYEEMGGFPVTRMHPGEDMVFSIELMKRGYKTALFNDAFVYHKRRSTLQQYFRQVYRFGYTRYIISKVYPETRKIIYWFPSAFLFGSVFLIFTGAFLHLFYLIPLALLMGLIFTASTYVNQSARVGFLSIVTSIIQLAGYGWGFAMSLFRVEVLGQDEYGVLKKGFYPDN
jgi:glycosyltransferase involved in cell wall biosynthesis